MKVKIVCIGKISLKFLKDGIGEYVKRISKYSKIKIIELNEVNISDNANQIEIDNALKKEGKNILKYISSDDYVFTLDVNGQMIDNYEYVSILTKAMINGKSNFVFVIGSSHGISDEIRQRANLRWSFSKLIFTHQMIRLILLEQIYRGFKIINNEKYHK